jgi:hypothetical protein
MNIDSLLYSFFKKAHWTAVAKPVLSTCKLPRGQGVEKTIIKLKSIYNEGKQGSSFDKFFQLYNEYILSGEKYVNFYKVSRTKLDKLFSSFRNYEFDENLFSINYPYFLSDEDLKEVRFNEYKFVKITTIEDSDVNDSALVLIFSSKFFYNQRVEILPHSLNLEEESLRYFEQYQRMYGVTRQVYQSFDTIVIWKNSGIVEVRCDMRDVSLIQESRERSSILIRCFNTIVEQLVSEVNLLSSENTINLFPLVSSIYNNPKEGNLLAINFTTDEGTDHYEKNSSNNDHKDFRKTTYHLNGKQGVSDNITLFNLIVSWDDAKIITQPKLYLPGTTLSLHTSYLKELIIENCVRIKDYNFIFQKILNYLSFAKSNE